MLFLMRSGTNDGNIRVTFLRMCVLSEKALCCSGRLLEEIRFIPENLSNRKVLELLENLQNNL